VDESDDRREVQSVDDESDGRNLNEILRKLSSANVKAFAEAVKCFKSSTDLRSFQPNPYGSPALLFCGAHTRKIQMYDAVLGTYFQAQLFMRL
jgi:hypothetical protein